MCKVRMGALKCWKKRKFHSRTGMNPRAKDKKPTKVGSSLPLGEGLG